MHKTAKSTKLESAKQSNEAKEENTKKKRPWRQAMRHIARQLRMVEMQNGGESTDGEEADGNKNLRMDGDEKTTKKRKISKEKRKRRMKRLKSEGGSGEEEGVGSVDGDDQSNRMNASRFRFLNEQLYTKPSTAAVQLFQEDPNAFRAYHKGYKVQLRKWPVNPLEMLMMDLSSLPPKSVVADLGCGEAELAKKLGDKLQIHSFDLVAANERVTEADMAKLPLSNESVDVCVYCLSLMGTNLAQFLREAHRVLKMHGKIKIVEITSRFKSISLFLSSLSKMGFQLKRKKQIGNGFFTMITMEKITAKVENKRPQNLKLEPCLYRKR